MINVLKVAGLALVGIVLIAMAFRLIGSSFGSVLGPSRSGLSTPSYDMGYGGAAEESYKMFDDSAIALSTRNVVGAPGMPEVPPEPQTVPGDDAEEFEVTEYSAYIETRALERDCQTIAELKSREYAIFERANESDHSCNYVFKVKRANIEEILAVIDGLDPKDLSESTYTIKQTIEDFTSEEDILLKKLQTIDDTLDQATTAYDELTELATRVQDVESLATIINSKINIIERLTQERINVSSRLERLQRAKAVQLDRLEYTYFHVDIYENKYVDWENLRDSWKSAVQGFVWDMNDIFQGISVQLVTLLLRIAQFAIYLVILLLFVKYGWKSAKYIWRK